MASANLAAAYLPLDRRLALLRSEELPGQADGAVLFADIGGYTTLGEELAQRLGPHQGAEELNRQVSACFADLIAAVHTFRGAVVLFAGDAVLAVFGPEGDPHARATGAAYAIQEAMGRHPALSLKVSIGVGPVHRRLLGDPAYGLHDLVSGPALYQAVEAMGRAAPGGIAGPLAEEPAIPCPWPAHTWDDLPEKVLRAWVPAEIYGRLTGGAAGFVAELRQAVPLFVQVDCAEEDLAAYVAQAQAVLASFAGRLNSVEILDKGTVLVAFFGAPIARGDDPVRAVGAARALIAAGRRWGRLASLRIGLTMAPLYAGLVGSPARLAYTVYGDEMNVAARLMEAAEPWEVLASERVRRAAESRCQFTPLPGVLVKGRAEMVSVARVEGEREAPTLYERRGPLVGRREELDRLKVLAAAAQAGGSRVVVLKGEAGIGKSRLAAALLHHWRDRGGQVAVGQAQATAQQQPYLAWGGLLRQLFRLRGDDLDVPRLQSLLHASNPALVPRLPLLGDVLGLPIADNDLTRSFDARLRQASTQALVVDLLRAQAAPLLLLEDAHWMDGPSWGLTLAVARGLAGRPLLLCLTARPMEPPPTALAGLAALPAYEEVPLAGFSPDEAVALARVRLGVSALAPELAEFLQVQGQGNPFFIEEILHALQEAGFLQHDGDRVVVHRPLEEAQLPDNVQGVVLARIDRLDEPDRLTLKVAAVIGRVFAYPVLRDVHPAHAGHDAVLREHLDDLQAFDIVLTETTDPDLSYIFKHAVTHEAAYGTLLFAQRRDLHGRIARYYETRYRDSLEPHYALLAHHYGRSGDEERQVYYCGQAGYEAARRYANTEAISLYTQALEILARREGSLQGEALRENRLRRWDLLEKRESTYDIAGRRDEQRADVERLLNLAQELGRLDLHLQALLRQAHFLYLINDYEGAQEILGRSLQQAHEQGDLLREGRAFHILGRIAYYRGYCQEALQHYERALTPFRGLGLEREVAEVLNSLGLAQYSLGLYDRALANLENALPVYRRAGDHSGETQALGNIGLVRWDCGQYEAALEHFRQALLLARQIGNRRHEVYTLNNMGDLYRYMGRYEEAIEYLQEAVRLSVETYNPGLEGECLNNLGRVYLEQGRFDQARGHLEQALRIREVLGETGCTVHDHSFLGRASLGLGKREQALVHSRRALDLLRGEGVAVDWEHQVHYNHYLVCRAAGLHREAAEALERAYRTMQSLAETMGEEGRRSFLEDVRVNREIAAAWGGRLA